MAEDYGAKLSPAVFQLLLDGCGGWDGRRQLSALLDDLDKVSPELFDPLLFWRISYLPLFPLF